ncbi:uncharacterized protein KQ657_000368 [Scheffersomyces spartinae]|uniref:RRM domain-containing protein n=1 Tax=Scheffersomyces spartinae TaxID=45513 RepID=A0A9P8AJ07_9ASCO|nr:uncharacterized protein KQ657_000368 [Scheffersomyces spartinae]KAG7193681.1 hypothetical protein KQ657_000368 [Scheffersomyces spartinae]
MNIPLVLYNADGTLSSEFSKTLLYNSNFPLKIKIDLKEIASHQELEPYFKNFDIEEDSKQNVIILLSVSKLHLDKLISRLHKLKIHYNLDYSQFRSNPCNLFIKNISKDVDESCLERFVKSNCPYKSLNEIVILHHDEPKEKNGVNSLNIGTFAIAKFLNHLDVDHLLDNKHVLEMIPNEFNSVPTIPLYINAYISRRERTLRRKTNSLLCSGSLTSSPLSFAASNSYDSVVLTDLDKFFGGKLHTLLEFDNFLSIFKLFELKIKCIYFPIVQEDENNFRVDGFGYITFFSTQEDIDINFNVLMLVYYLQGLTYSQVLAFNDANLTNLNDSEIQLTGENINGLKITINQAKFNMLLEKDLTPSLSIDENGKVGIQTFQPLGHLFRSLNFQETNIYVNNLPLAFKQDDIAWESFWSRLGDCKLAKIIKPDFYNNNNNGKSNAKYQKTNNMGRIGFVFFKDFKTAIRAILLTNNKYFRLKNQTVNIQSSFAIQKAPSSKQRFFETLSQDNTQSPATTNRTMEYNYSNEKQSMHSEFGGQNMSVLGQLPLVAPHRLPLTGFPFIPDQHNSVLHTSSGPFSGVPYFYYPVLPSMYYYYPLNKEDQLDT